MTRMSIRIDTNKGPIEGFSDDGVRKWLGIPYAKPPVGELRFRRARECDPWSAVRSCKAFAPDPIQFGGAMSKASAKSPSPTSEDCLYLNVWAPEKAKGCPVFVYIYGGAFHTGQSSDPDFDLSSFAKDGIVGVSFNYRLGPLGFYDFRSVAPEFESNCGISDMIAALRWIRDNIEAFGGDPTRVTICGQSAGGTGVFALMSAPSARGLFHQAITMSGLAGNVTGLFTSEVNNKLFFDAVGLEPVYAHELKRISIGALKRGGDAVFDHFNDLYPGINITGPVIDDLVPDYTWNMLSKGNAAGVKCLMGTCQNDGGLIFEVKLTLQSWDQVDECLDLNDLGSLSDDFKEAYGGGKGDQAVMDWTTDRQFWVDTVRCALAQSAHADVYKYRYDFAPKEGTFAKLGATHCSDISPALDTYNGFCEMFYDKTPMEDQKKLHHYLHGSFVNFIKTGDPNGAVGIKWQPYSAENQFEMGIDLACSALINPNRKRYELWEPIHLYEPDYAQE